jgi:TolB-like protein/class 3 adenylate cyclase
MGVGMERRLAAILIADVVGYTRLIHRDEEGTRARFLAHLKDILRPKITEHRGRLIKVMGDGLLIEFPSIVNAVRCAVDVQQAEAANNASLPLDQKLQFRIGINLGDVIVEGKDVHGDGVNIAERLQNLADPGGIVISGSAYDEVRNKLDVALESLGEQRVKNIDEPMRAYRVRLDGVQSKGRLPIGRWRRTMASAAAAVVVVTVVIAGWWLWMTSHPTAISAAPAIAVLPFQNLSQDLADSRLADGITADIITDLSRYRDFAVIARNSTEVYKDKPTDVRQIGKDLGVSYVLEGSFQRQGDKVRITTQLIETTSGTQIWSERYDRPAKEIFAVQSEVADHIANSLGGSRGQIPNSALAAAKRRPPGDLSAYELYLLGHEKIQGATNESQLEAKRLLEEAIRIDPQLARAHTMLAWTYAWRATFEADAPTLHKQMVDVARQAVELDPLDAEAHQALGYALGLNGDLKQAEIEFDESLRLNPNSFDILAVYACWAPAFGRVQAGAEAVDQARRLNPNYPVWAVTCFRLSLAMAGRYEDAVQTQERQPEDQWNSDGFVITAGSLAALGRLDEAKAVVARGSAKFPGLLSIERFALNRGWSSQVSPVLTDLMRKAGFPPCATDKELEGIANPVRLSECEDLTHLR